MCPNGREGVRHRANDPLCLRLRIQPEAAMDARHDEVEAGQDIIRIVKRAVFENIRLDPLQDAEISSIPAFSASASLCCSLTRSRERPPA